MAFFVGKASIGYIFCYSCMIFEALHIFWGFQWILFLFGVQIHFVPLNLSNSCTKLVLIQIGGGQSWKYILNLNYYLFSNLYFLGRIHIGTKQKK